MDPLSSINFTSPVQRERWSQGLAPNFVELSFQIGTNSNLCVLSNEFMLYN